MTFISRRELLKRAAAITAATRASNFSAPITGASHSDAHDAGQAAQDDRAPLESLTAGEMAILDAMVARLIPSDVNGPGAAEARVARYIDRALAGALSASRSLYASGLPALDRYAQSSRGAPFVRLSGADQDAVLTAVESGAADGFNGSSAQFLAMVLSHTHQGMFGDPYYGGNANFAGWDLIGYPGVRTMVSPADQKRFESNELKPNHKSAYEYDGFTKARSG
jgi:gluconate 2-dehydrogenase gamma chain